ncbi:MAG: hypothetical protein EOM38_09510 [Bacilli bacterium]|nr:hypothetical protein [Bacilli bacterium]
MALVEKYFNFRMYRSTKLSFILVLASLILFFILSPATAYENGPLENLQVLELLAASAFGCYLAAKAASVRERNIWYSGAVTALICAGRELNWGRVFYPVAGHNKFLPLKALWYGPIVYPVVGLAIITVLVVLFRSRLLSFIAERKIPFWNFLLFIVLYFLASLAEHRPMYLFEQHLDGEVLEELFECICYWLMIDIMRIMGRIRSKN